MPISGRAIYILQQTLPSFFSTGLVTSLDKSTGGESGKDGKELSIYSPSIRLEYRPPAPFPPPFPRTAHVEGELLVGIITGDRRLTWETQGCRCIWLHPFS